jgi:dienelactone hydrolase
LPVDERLLLAHRRYEDAAAGYSEEFLQPTLGGGRTVAVLARPLGPAQPVGWVILHSFGLEQMHLSRLDVVVARSLAAAGFPVLRFHGQGYGDSERMAEPIGLASHLADATDAVALMAEQDGVERVGVLGARFGGTVAALVADRERLAFMGLWEPMARGSHYMRDILRSRVFAEMVGKSDEAGASQMDELRAELAGQGWSDIKGLLLTSETNDAIAAVDLSKDLEHFNGHALVVGVSRTGKPSPGLSKLTQRLADLGATCSVVTLQDTLAAQFGQFHFQTTDGGRAKVDTQYELNEQIAEATSRWATEVVQASPALQGGLP